MKTSYIIRATRPGEQSGVSIEGENKEKLKKRFFQILEEIGLDKNQLEIKIITSRPAAKKRKV